MPSNGLDQLAVGLGRFEAEIDTELHVVAGGGAMFKAVRGEYGSGKTFFARWLADLLGIWCICVRWIQRPDSA